MRTLLEAKLGDGSPYDITIWSIVAYMISKPIQNFYFILALTQNSK